MSYGVTPEGFARKPLPIILAEIEERMIARFGSGIIQTSQSPLGQLNGLFADLTHEEQERLEDVYQSFDVDQAEGPRLDIVAKLRRLIRNDGETDEDFRLRITNEAKADIRLGANINRLLALDGVTWAHAIENNTDTTSAKGMPAHSVAYAVTGGDDELVGLNVYQLSVPGIGLYGNTAIPVVADGFCQTVEFIRPTLVPIMVEVDVRELAGSDCAPPSPGTVAQHIIDAYAGMNGYHNGDTVSEEQIASITAQMGGLKAVETRIARRSDLIISENIETTLFERPVIISPYVSVRYV